MKLVMVRVDGVWRGEIPYMDFQADAYYENAKRAGFRAFLCEIMSPCELGGYVRCLRNA